MFKRWAGAEGPTEVIGSRTLIRAATFELTCGSASSFAASSIWQPTFLQVCLDGREGRDRSLTDHQSLYIGAGEVQTSFRKFTLLRGIPGQTHARPKLSSIGAPHNISEVLRAFWLARRRGRAWPAPEHRFPRLAITGSCHRESPVLNPQ